jgi:hypothetical protein
VDISKPSPRRGRFGRCVGLTVLFAAQWLAGPTLAGGHGAPAPPDLSGVWTNESMTQLVRPKAFKTLAATPAEAAAYEGVRVGRYAKETANLAAKDLTAPAAGDLLNHDPQQWYGPPEGLARIGGQIRTSWIVEPSDGSLPLTPAARTEAEAVEARDDHGLDNPEDRFPDERCLEASGGGAGAPMIGAGANTVFQIFQSRDHVVLLAEDNHDARIVPLDRRKHLPASVRPWMGDSIGWWEQGALVVETTNFARGDRWRAGSAYFPIGEKARITERFMRIGPKQILYRFEVSDSENYTQTWRGEVIFNAMSGMVYEFACHEGNYALGNILAGARADERRTAGR